MRERLQTIQLFLQDRSWIQLAVLAVTIVIGVLYIWQVNLSATRGFAMRDLDRQVEDMGIQNERNLLEVARLRSVDSVSKRVQMLGLVEVDVADYIDAGDSAVAVNK